MNSPVSFLTNLRHDRLQRNKMFSWNEIINVLKHSRGNLNPFTTFKPCVCGLWKNTIHTIKTIICNGIFPSLRRKKIQSPAKHFKELFSLVCYIFALNKPSSALNHLKAAFTLTNQNWVTFSCILLLHVM